MTTFNVDVGRTAAATAARRTAYARRLALLLAERLPDLDSEALSVLTGALIAETVARGVDVEMFTD